MPAHATEFFHAPAGAAEVWWIDSRVDVKLTVEQTQGHAGAGCGKRAAARRRRCTCTGARTSSSW